MGKSGASVLNEKVVAARDRKAQKKVDAKVTEVKAKEDAYWDAHANPKLKKDVKKEEQERKAEEARRRKEENKRLAEQEEAEVAAARRKSAGKAAAAGKVTAHELALQRERDERENEKLAHERANAAKRMVSEQAYAASVEVENVNKLDNGIEASGVDAALSALTLRDAAPLSPEDRNPGKRAKAAWDAYYAEQLPLLKSQKPGLRLLQYKSQIFEKWQRDPRNPRNLAQK